MMFDDVLREKDVRRVPSDEPLAAIRVSPGAKVIKVVGTSCSALAVPFLGAAIQSRSKPELPRTGKDSDPYVACIRRNVYDPQPFHHQCNAHTFLKIA